MRRWGRSAAAVAAMALVISLHPTPLAHAFCLLDARWPTNPVEMSFNFAPSGELANGTDSWGQNAESAMAEWSEVSESFAFESRGQTSAGQDDRDGINNMLFDDNIAGDPFDPEVLALTLSRISSDGAVLETDVIFTVAVQWNAYDGPLRTNGRAEPVFDFRRVALHELGHVLGLDHPDTECGQNGNAIMNAKTGELDRIAEDDRDGVIRLYGGASGRLIADAGPDQSGDGSRPFVLDGSGSRTSVGLIVVYEWFLEGRLIARGRFAEVELEPGVHRITLTVLDDSGDSDSDSVIITVGDGGPSSSRNELPIADAGEDQTVVEGQSVLLDGSGSSDPDGEIVRYVWSEEGVVIARGRIVAVTLKPGTHVVTLGVFDDGGGGGTDNLIITVSPLEREPVPPPVEPELNSSPPLQGAPCGALGWITLLTTFAALRCLKLRSRR